MFSEEFTLRTTFLSLRSPERLYNFATVILCYIFNDGRGLRRSASKTSQGTVRTDADASVCVCI